MIYVGQAGAGTSTATLASRIVRNHINGSRRGSTFRRRIAAILETVPHRASDKAPLAKAQITQWIPAHLSLIAVEFNDRSRRMEFEDEALRRYDPPLNLMGMAASDARARLLSLADCGTILGTRVVATPGVAFRRARP
jgi:hypothetical protein